MAVKEAIVARIKQLCKERHLAYNALAVLSDGYRDLSVVTLKKLCDGLDITLSEFFSTPEFDALEQEIQ